MPSQTHRTAATHLALVVLITVSLGWGAAPAGAASRHATVGATETAQATPPAHDEPPPGFEPTVVFGVHGFLDADGQPVVEWQTGSSAATVGFRLMRNAGGRIAPVHKGWVAPVFGAPGGGTYQVVDRRARLDSQVSYFVAERDEAGAIHLHGPFAVEFAAQADSPFRSRSANAVSTSDRRAPRASLRQGPYTEDPVPPDPMSTVAKARIRDGGLYRVTAQELAPALAQTVHKVEIFIDRGLIAVSNQGRSVAWFANDAGTEIYFYAEAIDNRYTLDNVYWITLGAPAALMEPVDVTAAAAQPGGYYAGAAAAEDDTIAALNVTKFEDVDYWYWEGINSEDPAQNFKTFPLSSPAVAADGGTASLTVHLAGATKDPGYKYHHARISVNGTAVGDIYWMGLFTVEQTLDFSASLLAEENVVEVEGIVDPGNLGSIFFVDCFELTYPRYYQANGDELLVAGDSNPVITVDGVSGSDAVVLDLTDPTLPRRATGTLIEADGAAFRVSFTPQTPQTPYYVATLAAAHTVLDLAADRRDSDPTGPDAGGEYVVIAPAAFKAQAERLAGYREQTGLSAYVITLEDLYDEFAGGIADPWAVNAFLAWAADNWSVPPHYVALVGKGTYDPKDNLGYGDNVLTPVLAATPYGMAASDSLLADIDGDRKLDFAIGRIPVITPAELDRYIDKVIAFEASSGAWRNEALLLADDPDAAGDFTAQSETAATHLAPGTVISRSYLEELTVAEARSTMFAAWVAGKKIVNYVGHGGVTVLASEQLLLADEVTQNLAGTGMPAIFSALSCVVGRFELAGLQALSEALVLTDDGGAVTVWAPTSPSLSGAAMGLNQSYFDLLAMPNQRVGDATMGAIQESGPTSPQFLLETFTLIGDPAVRVD
jgi:Peptidase family C25